MLSVTEPIHVFRTSVHNKRSDKVPDDVPDNVPDGSPDGSPDGTPDEVPDGVPDGVPDEVPDEHLGPLLVDDAVDGRRPLLDFAPRVAVGFAQGEEVADPAGDGLGRLLRQGLGFLLGLGRLLLRRTGGFLEEDGLGDAVWDDFAFLAGGRGGRRAWGLSRGGCDGGFGMGQEPEPWASWVE
ncbi:hypothetical protein PG984_008142 [Apiospora sp. TS-2023a]